MCRHSALGAEHSYGRTTTSPLPSFPLSLFPFPFLSFLPFLPFLPSQPPPKDVTLPSYPLYLCSSFSYFFFPPPPLAFPSLNWLALPRLFCRALSHTLTISSPAQPPRGPHLSRRSNVHHSPRESAIEQETDPKDLESNRRVPGKLVSQLSFRGVQRSARRTALFPAVIAAVRRRESLTARETTLHVDCPPLTEENQPRDESWAAVVSVSSRTNRDRSGQPSR